MIIDDSSYKLPRKNYVPIENEKKRIILSHTNNHDMRHVKGWLTRHNGKYCKTAPYTIGYDGIIYKHYDPKFCTKLFNSHIYDNTSVVILIENDGSLTKKPDSNEFITWMGDIYKETTKVGKKDWRGSNFWAPYNQKQFEAAVELVSTLCDRFSIPPIVFSHNTKVIDLKDYKGVLYKSNIERYYMDLNPTWDFEKFKTKLEQYEPKH